MALSVRALNAIFEQWNLKAEEHWNISGEPCSGTAIDSTPVDNYDPFIKCDCSFNRSTVCHITQLRVYAIDVVGPIPEELWTLTYLINLNLAQNYLTGPLSPSIGNLTRMQWLSLGINAFSGEVPKELGQLTELLSLAFGGNNFSGPLPRELGNLSKLQQLYIDSSGISGEIPSTFANLQNLVTVWASDNAFTGQIPEFIGNWTKLQTLRLQGNSFEGPIPASFSNLNSMLELRISELANGSSSLEFINDMKNLSVLVLRNNNISDTFPSNIAEYKQLTQLDLSFNNIRGQIPDSLFNNLTLLSYLFLGNNQLNGTIPGQKRSSSLVNIDLSYNNLVGTIPSWANNQTNLQLNLVGNNLTIDQTSNNNSSLPSGLNCLQKDFPCNRGRGTYSQFGIKCGGPQITSSSGIVLERDNETLGPATYYVSDTESWGVSNGKLVLKDFDIKKEAGGISTRAVNKEFTAQAVSENYLEVHLFWAGKGTCCIPLQGTYGPSISAISAKPEFTPTVSNKPPTSKNSKNNTGMIVGIAVGVGGFSFLAVLAAFCIVQRIKRSRTNDDEELLGMDVKPFTFSYEELKIATNDFNSANKLGEGGFGPVYKGTLVDGRAIAVKQLSLTSHQGKSQFVNEIATISAVQHRNLVKLYGCCYEGQKRMLVYEHLENKSLDQALFGEKMYLLEWAWNLYEQNRELELVDSRLSEFDEEEVGRMIRVALLCTQTSPSLRPTMSRVVALLSGDVEVSTEITRPGYLTGWKFEDVSTVSSDNTGENTRNIIDESFNNSIASTSKAVLSPTDARPPMLNIIKEGR
ncbi:hypothetical protein FEM48_Zijuj05G0037300 [Ziziphus jujuba var. spinosa]|uniref:non-specific serine/threonine protein kinase n=1 Tax=Ziziphus jujuba var. spinosa TaxID=714518 RepID=A0A978VCM3_ZIZJJ|nr:hypothetical protein FEM48_Zijuj05G0037300 [Ziziphus jujuba var. spinosa]